MFHEVPTTGYSNHGLVNYNMKFFWMLAKSNDYEWVAADFIFEGNPSPISTDIQDFIMQHNLGRRKQFGSNFISDGVIVVILKKKSNWRFSPPLDVNNGTKPTSWRFLTRYPRVFLPNYFSNVIIRRLREIF